MRPLAVAFGLVTSFMVVEFVTGLMTGSLALMSDAGHMATDALGLGMALAAVMLARSAPKASQTYGRYRAEILAALANAFLLGAVAVYVIWEGVGRLVDPPHVATTPMLVVAVIGLVVNLVSWRLLRTGAETSLNVAGALAEVVADIVGSVGVIVAAVVTITTGWLYADPLVAILIGLWILPRAWRLGVRAVRILSQAAPERVDVGELREELTKVAGVVDVHDLHVWTLTSGMEVATAHLTVTDETDAHETLDAARGVIADRFDIEHATVQVEPTSHRDCVEASW